MPLPQSALVDALRHLHDEYILKVNAAVAGGRSDVASELADQYADDAQRLMVAAAASSA